MAVDADALAPRISARTKIPSIRAREAAELPITATTSAKKKRPPPRGNATTPTTASTTTGFSAISQSPKAEMSFLNREVDERAGQPHGGHLAQLSQERGQRVKEVDVFCICRGPDDGTRPMIQCDGCDDW